MGHRPCVSSPIFDRFDSYAVSVVRPVVCPSVAVSSPKNTLRVDSAFFGFPVYRATTQSIGRVSYRRRVLPVACPIRLVCSVSPSSDRRLQCPIRIAQKKEGQCDPLFLG